MRKLFNARFTFREGGKVNSESETEMTKQTALFVDDDLLLWTWLIW